MPDSGADLAGRGGVAEFGCLDSADRRVDIAGSTFGSGNLETPCRAYHVAPLRRLHRYFEAKPQHSRVGLREENGK
jgi:hypothetical protein